MSSEKSGKDSKFVVFGETIVPKIGSQGIAVDKTGELPPMVVEVTKVHSPKLGSDDGYNVTFRPVEEESHNSSGKSQVGYSKSYADNFDKVFGGRKGMGGMVN